MALKLVTRMGATAAGLDVERTIGEAAAAVVRTAISPPAVTARRSSWP
jgi:hypothetical protein